MSGIRFPRLEERGHHPSTVTKPWFKTYMPRFPSSATIIRPQLLNRGIYNTYATVFCLLKIIAWSKAKNVVVLCYRVPFVNSANTKFKISDVWGIRCWDLAKLSTIIPDQVRVEIMVVHVQAIPTGRDSIRWVAASDARYSTKTAYASLTYYSDMMNVPWMRIWKYKVPEKICYLDAHTETTSGCNLLA